MRTRKGLERIMTRIMETGGLTPDMADDIQRLRNEFDEREGILWRYGDVQEGDENEDEDYSYEWTAREPDTATEEGIQEDAEFREPGTAAEDIQEDAEFREEIQKEDEEAGLIGEETPDWETKYNDLKRDYINRFFTSGGEIMDDTVEDVKRDGENQTIEQLFERTEG